MPQFSLRLCLLAGTALVSPAFAQEADITDLDEIRIEALDAQAALGNAEITQAEIEARNPASMRDVFAGESAVTSSGGASIAQKVFVHGIEESLLSVTIDGARQNKSAFHHAGNVLMDPALLKSVDISSGLAPADAGSGAMAGSIAYETKDAHDLLEDGDTFGGMATLQGGTNGKGVGATLTVFGATGGFEYLLSGTRLSGSDYKDGNGTTVPGTEPELNSYLAKIAYTTQSGHKVSFSASQTEDTGKRAAQFHGFYGVYFIRPDFFGLPSTPSVLLEGQSRRTSYSFTYTDTTPDGWFAPTAQISYNEQKMDVVGLWGVNKSLSGVFKNEFNLNNGSVNVGIDFFDERAEGYSRSARNLGFTGREKHQGVGIFAQARQDFGSRVSVSYGARYDVQKFTGGDGSTHEDQGLSANAAIDFMLTDNLALNAGIATSWGGYELGEAALINLSGAWDYAGLKASRAQSARIGLRFDNGPWQISGAFFQTNAYDLSSVIPGYPTNSRSDTTDIKTRGFDASVGYDWGNGFARANYTFADVTQDGSAIGGTSYYHGRPMGHIVGLEAGWQASNSLLLGGNAQIAFKYNDVAVGDAALPAYEVFNVFAEYVPQNMRNLKIRFDVQNAFDTSYVARGADISSRATALTEPGRTFGIKATFNF